MKTSYRYDILQDPPQSVVGNFKKHTQSDINRGDKAWARPHKDFNLSIYFTSFVSRFKFYVITSSSPDLKI